ncbi:MAG: transglycosylase SLT domain-containing protein, partial [Chloroflexota bacterium]|nr:transglycosylase SLT domain-containing protein [Chloroflexota bacterium]
MQPPVLTLSGDQSEVWAGGTLQLTAMVAHGGAGPDEYVLSIRGVDPAWVTLRPPTLSVDAGSQAYATIVIAPPADAASEELVLTVRAFARMSNIVVEATQIALLYGATGAPPMRAIAPVGNARGGLSRTAILAFAGGFAVLALVVGLLVVLAIRSRGHTIANAACVARPLKQVDLYSDDLVTAIRIREPDLSDMKVLRTESADTLSPLFSSLVALSPDGSRVAYVTASNEALDDAHLWAIDVANPSQRQELASVPKGMWVVRPAWSADNRQVAFVRYNDQQSALGQSQLELWIGEAGQQAHKVAAPPELRPEGFYGDASQSLCWAQDNRSVLFPSVTSVSAAQTGKSTGTTRPLVTTPPITQASAPHQVAVDVLTGSTETVAASSAVAPRDGGAGTQTPPTGTGLGACGLPAFSQNDPTWRNVIMQSSGDTIGRYGCAVTASAMLMNYYGAILTPPQLTACLDDHADLLAWSSVAGCANGAVTGNNALDFSWPSLDQVLAGGDPAIVGLLRGQTGLHFVVVTAGGGGEASNYLVNDPWDGTTTKTLQSFIGSGYNPRWIRTFAGMDRACPRLVGSQTPAADATGIATPADGPLVAPTQLLSIFAKVAEQTGVPKEILLAMARVESGFTPRAMGPPNASLAGTDDERALGMMQFLPSTYRMFSKNVDAATGRPLGDAGIWDPEASIWAAAFFLQQRGIAADPRAALGAFTVADWYPDLVLKVAAQYRTAVISDDNLYDASGTSKPGTLSAPNPINPPPVPGTAIGLAASGTLQQAGTTSNTPVGTAASGSAVSGAPVVGSATASTDSGRTPIRWSVPDGSVTRREVRLDVNSADDIGQVMKFTLFSLSLPGVGSGVINQPTASRPVTAGTVIKDDGVYEAVLVTQQGSSVRVSRRRFTIDRTPPRLDVTVSTGAPPTPPGTTGTGTTGSATGATGSAARPVTTPDPSRPSSAGLTRLKIGYADQLSGVIAVEYQLDGGAWQLYFGDVSFKPELFIAAPGNHTIRARATDFAGNVSTERALDFTVT